MRRVGARIGDLQRFRKRAEKIASSGEYIYGLQSCRAALLANKRTFFELFIKETSKRDEIRDALITDFVQITGKTPSMRPQQFFGDIFQDKVHQGIALNASPLTPDSITSLPLLPETQKELWVVLDSVQDPHNFGAILRSCLFFGVSGVVFDTIECSGLKKLIGCNGTDTITHLSKFSTVLEDKGWTVFGTGEEGTSPPTTQNPAPNHSILVLGNEGTGLRNKVEQHCDSMICVNSLSPMIDSLNVSVASGILLYAFAQSAGLLPTKK